QGICQQTLKDPCVLITNDDFYRVPAISSGVSASQQSYYHTGPSLGLEEDLPIPDFNHLPSSLEEEDNNNHTNTLRSAIFQKILNSYPQLNRKLKRSHHVAKKFQQTPSNLSDCVYQTSLTPDTTDDGTFSDLASSIMDDEFYGGYCSFSDNASVNSSGSISPNSSAVELLQQKLLCDVDVKTECSKFEEVCSNLDKISKTCDETTKSVTYVVKSMPKPAKYQCNVCGKIYKGNTNLNYHMATHTGVRPHNCSVCGKAFTQKSTLRTHFRIHTGEKPYKCRTCVRAFADYSTCMKHERTHSGEKPYACPVCGKCFAQSGNMLRHRQTHKKN
ncbi:zinc finger protein 90 homolog, partial [Saccostrea cucullata]|uniref:zinc finger protein 90 homolog n=1 Tax=Saccostrea cuccullata TaxID=36930 RepID=UPI002ED50ADF